MRRNLLRRNLLSLLLPGLFSGLSALPLTAQVPGGVPARAGQDPTLVDKVIAVVGDSVILLGELEREHELAREQGVDMTEAEVLDNLINLQVILQTAARDSTLIPPAAEVNRRVDQHVESVRADFPDEAAFQQALAQEGMTLATYREQLRSQIRSDLIRTAFVQRRYQTAPPVVVSDAEMRAFFEEHRHSPELQQRPELLTVRQVIILAGASDAAWARAHHVADSLHALLLRGADFAELAREHSEDPGSAEEGGDLGWIARGELVPEFERAAFALIDGRVSPPVRTQFGYHVILAERSRPGEKRLRHILIRPEVEPGDIERSRALAEDVARRIREGEDALALARAHGDPDYPRELQVERGQEAQQLPPVFAQNLFGTQQGDVVGPFEANIRQRDYVVVLQVTQVREAGEFTFEDVRDVIREILSQQKREETMYRDLRERTYVELRF